MSKRPPGRPKAAQPKDIRVTVRLSAREADLLQRLAGDRSLSDAIRMCIKDPHRPVRRGYEASR
jgi:hypothetical protein